MFYAIERRGRPRIEYRLSARSLRSSFAHRMIAFLVYIAIVLMAAGAFLRAHADQLAPASNMRNAAGEFWYQSQPALHHVAAFATMLRHVLHL